MSQVLCDDIAKSSELEIIKKKVEIDAPKEVRKTESKNVASPLKTLPQTQLAKLRNSGWKSRMGVIVVREFPPKCGKLNQVSLHIDHKTTIDSLNGDPVVGEFPSNCEISKLALPNFVKKPNMVRNGVTVVQDCPPYCERLNQVLPDLVPSNCDISKSVLPNLVRKPNMVRKGVTVVRDFPPYCGSLNQVLPDLVQRSNMAMIETDDKKIDVPLIVDLLKEEEITDNTKQDIEKGLHCTSIEHGHNERVDEAGILSPLERKMIQPLVSTEMRIEDDGVQNLSDSIDKKIISSSMDKLSEDKYPSEKENESAFEGGVTKISHLDGQELEMVDVERTKADAIVEADDQCKGMLQEISPNIKPYNNCEAAVSRNKVKQALNAFEETCTMLGIEQQKQENLKRKNMGGIYVTAATLLKKQKKWVNSDQEFIGHVPGIEVGECFRYRAELAIIGLHREFYSGIQYMKKDKKLIAVSVVASGRYENEVDYPNVLIYSGQGGNPKVAAKEPKDQKLEGGNLALRNSIEEQNPVRVIRGRQVSKPKGAQVNGMGTKTYIYVGLYNVVNYWQERGQFGKLVYKFRLEKIGQQINTQARHVKKFNRKRKAPKEQTLVDDLSERKEKLPIRVKNSIDVEKPLPFHYIPKIIHPKSYDLPTPNGCNCSNGCSNSEFCSCAIKNGGELPFNNNGALIKAKPIVYECGPSCKCPPTCMNRVSQHDIRFQLEVFKTSSKGWGVKSRDYIPSGSFVCEYVGELLNDKETEQRTDDEYLFDIGKNITDIVHQKTLQGNCEFESKSLEDGDEGFTIDGLQYGNVGRFINHSCSPNLVAQDVMFDHDNQRIPHVMFFATMNIRPSTELTYDYNYKLNYVYDADGNIKVKYCYCGSQTCSGRMY